MASVGQVYHNVLDASTGDRISTSGIDIYSDILSQLDISEVTQLGVSAPAGTKMILNGNKNIIIGRTGIYELGDNIQITSISFVRPVKYIRDDSASQSAIEQGTAAMAAANETRQEALTQLSASYPTIPNIGDEGYEEYQAAYNQIQDTYVTSYKTAHELYTRGINGIYTLVNTSNPQSEENFGDIQDLYVLYTYE